MYVFFLFSISTISFLLFFIAFNENRVRPGPAPVRIQANRDDFAANRLGHMPAAQHSKQYIKDKAGQPARERGVWGGARTDLCIVSRCVYTFRILLV